LKYIQLRLSVENSNLRQLYNSSNIPTLVSEPKNPNLFTHNQQPPWQPLKMALLQSKNNSQSSNCGGEVVARRAVILASAYVVDRSTMLTGFHYSTTGADGSLLPTLQTFD
jgi:hypothetical protein